MKTFSRFTLPILLVVGAFLAVQSIYIVEPDKTVVVQRLGATVSAVVAEGNAESVSQTLQAHPQLASVKVSDTPGLHFKIPFIDEVYKYSSRYLTYESLPETINTSDKRKLDIQMFAQYRIINPALYKMRLGSPTRLNKLMDDNVYPVVIQSANKLNFQEFFDMTTIRTTIDERRVELNNMLVSGYGIEIIDIGIYRKNFPESNIASIEDKMSKEIQKESEQLRAEGDAFYVESSSETDRKAQEIIAKATEESAIIRAEAERQALQIYQSSLTKDVEFYRFIQRMNTFKEMEDQTIFFDQSNNFLDYLNGYK